MAKKTSKAKNLVKLDKSKEIIVSGVNKVSNLLSANMVPLMVMLMLVGSFYIGRLTAQVEYLKSGVGAVTPTINTQTADQEVRPTISLDQVKDVFKQNIIKIGDPNKTKLTVIEVSDPSCPFCHIASGTNSKMNSEDARFKLVADGGTYAAPVTEIKKLVASGKAAYAWIYTPGHGNGEVAAKSLYCANEKGKFWQVHEKLFSDAGYTLVNDVVGNDMAKSGQMVEFLKGAVDAKFLQSCLSSGKYDSVISENQQLAKSLGATATPSFFFNETFFEGAENYTNIEPVVSQILK